MGEREEYWGVVMQREFLESETEQIDISGMSEIERIILCAQSVSALLKITVIANSPGKKHFIEKILHTWFKAQFERNELICNICNQMMISLFNELESVRIHDKTLYTYLVKKIKDPEYYEEGFRFELFLANFLIKKEIQFEYGKPDYTIHLANKKIFIECTRAYIPAGTITTTEKLLSKVLKKLEKKNSEPYAQKSTALFFDVSFIVAQINKGVEINLQKICESIGGLKSKLNYGNIVLFYSAYNKENEQLEFKYQRIDLPNMDKNLSDFLDHHFVSGDFEINPTNEIFFEIY